MRELADFYSGEQTLFGKALAKNKKLQVGSPNFVAEYVKKSARTYFCRPGFLNERPKWPPWTLLSLSPPGEPP